MQTTKTLIRLAEWMPRLIWVLAEHPCHFISFVRVQLDHYRKIPKFSDARKFCFNLPKTQTKRPNLRVFCQKDAIGIDEANSEDPDQTAPLGAVLSGSALFAQNCLSENLGSLRYIDEI